MTAPNMENQNRKGTCCNTGLGVKAHEGSSPNDDTQVDGALWVRIRDLSAELILQTAEEINACPLPAVPSSHLSTSQTHGSHNTAWNASTFIMAIIYTTYRQLFIQFRSTQTSRVH